MSSFLCSDLALNVAFLLREKSFKQKKMRVFAFFNTEYVL